MFSWIKRLFVPTRQPSEFLEKKLPEPVVSEIVETKAKAPSDKKTRKPRVKKTPTQN